jgi:hypothetical protein
MIADGLVQGYSAGCDHTGHRYYAAQQNTTAAPFSIDGG